MDVKYIPSEWEKSEEGIGELIGAGHLGKGMIDNLKKISDLLEEAQADIEKYDVDGVISFSHTSHKAVYKDLFEDFSVLHRFAGKAGEIVDRTIDEPFYKDIDAFTDAMEGLSITEIKTKNRIGAKKTVVIPGEYGSNTMDVSKAEVSLEDLFNGSNAYAKQMKEEYDNLKLQNPDQGISEKDYEQAVLHSRAFQYDSIRDAQKKKEFWGQIASLAVIVGTSIICPPAGITLGAAYGVVELGSAVSGKDWTSGRELENSERVSRGVLAPLDIVPGINGMAKFAGTSRVVNYMGGFQQSRIGIGINFAKQKPEPITKLVGNALALGKSRIRSAANLAKDAPQKMKRKIKDDIIDASRIADSAYTFARNIPPRQMGLVADGIGRVRAPAENGYVIENSTKAMFSKILKNRTESGLVKKGTGNVLQTRKVSAGAEIIAQRVSKAELNLTPKQVPYKSLNRAQQKIIKEKIEKRTVTKEEYKRYQWNNRFLKRRVAGVNQFWKQEKKRILYGKPTTRDWNAEQRQEILKGRKPQFDGQPIIGHHTYNAMNYPHVSNRGELIYPVTTREHLKGWHGGNYSKNAPGRPVNPNFTEEF